MMRKKSVFFWIFLVGILLRLALIFLDYSWDVNNHISWATDLWTPKRGFPGFYETISANWFANKYPNYPPIALYIFYLIYPLPKIIESIAWFLNTHISLFPSKLIFFIQSRTFIAGVFKLPAIAADCGIAYLTFLFAKRILPLKKKIHLLIPSLVLFNPAFFFNSAYWGQIDAIPIFFALWSLYAFLYKKHMLFSMILFTASLLVKPTTLLYLPVYLLVLYRQRGWKHVGIGLACSIAIFYISFVPFYKTGNFFLFPWYAYKVYVLDAQSLPFVTNGLFNFWVLVTWFKEIKDITPFVFGISYRLWGYIAVGILALRITYYELKKSKLDNQSIFLAIFLISFGAILFLTKMHERYSMLPLPFLLLASMTRVSYLRYFIILSCISYLNLYHSWPVPHIGFLKYVLDLQIVDVTISLLNCVIFIQLLRSVQYLDENRHAS